MNQTLTHLLSHLHTHTHKNARATTKSRPRTSVVDELGKKSVRREEKNKRRRRKLRKHCRKKNNNTRLNSERTKSQRNSMNENNTAAMMTKSETLSGTLGSLARLAEWSVCRFVIIWCWCCFSATQQINVCVCALFSFIS